MELQVERTKWTDERIDDLVVVIREGFARTDAQLAEIRTDIRDLRSQMFQLWGATMSAVIVSMVVTVVAAIITRT